MVKSGDWILIEQAWEDESGAYHEVDARVKSIYKDGVMDLMFSTSDEVMEYLKGFQYKAEDYEPA